MSFASEQSKNYARCTLEWYYTVQIVLNFSNFPKCILHFSIANVLQNATHIFLFA